MPTNTPLTDNCAQYTPLTHPTPNSPYSNTISPTAALIVLKYIVRSTQIQIEDKTHPLHEPLNVRQEPRASLSETSAGKTKTISFYLFYSLCHTSIQA